MGQAGPSFSPASLDSSSHRDISPGAAPAWHLALQDAHKLLGKPEAISNGYISQNQWIWGSFQTCTHKHFLRPQQLHVAVSSPTLCFTSKKMKSLQYTCLVLQHLILDNTQITWGWGGVGLRPYQIYTTVQTIIIHRSWFYNPLLTISWEIHYSDPYTQTKSKPKLPPKSRACWGFDI